MWEIAPVRRADRLFELIQMLRSKSRPVTARELAADLEVSERTVYRDIAALQARRTPIDGAAGVGYILRKTYDLPPLNFDVEEIEAIAVGLSLLSRTGDTGLQSAAARVTRKIETCDNVCSRFLVSDFGSPPDYSMALRPLRAAIRSEQMLEMSYRNLDGISSIRRIKPIAILYFAQVNLLAAWCELRQSFRHFRIDRILRASPLDKFFVGESNALRDVWHLENSLDI